MPTAIDLPDDDDDEMSAAVPLEMAKEAKPKESLPSSSLSSSKGNSLPKKKTKKTIPSVTPKSAASKKRPAVSSSQTTNNSKKSKKIVSAGQMTLGSFFGAAASAAAKKPTPPPQSRPPSALPEDRYVDLKGIVLGKKSLQPSITETTTTPKPPRRVSPTMSQRKAWSSAAYQQNQDEEENEPCDDEEEPGTASAVSSPLAKQIPSKPSQTCLSSEDKREASNQEAEQQNDIDEEDELDEEHPVSTSGVSSPLAKETQLEAPLASNKDMNKQANEEQEASDTMDVSNIEAQGENRVVKKETALEKEARALHDNHTPASSEIVVAPSPVAESKECGALTSTMDDTKQERPQPEIGDEDVSAQDDSNEEEASEPPLEQVRGIDSPTEGPASKEIPKSMTAGLTAEDDTDIADQLKESGSNQASTICHTAEATTMSGSSVEGTGAKTSECSEDSTDCPEKDSSVVANGSTIDDAADDTDKDQDAPLNKLQSLYDAYFAQAVTLFAACRERLVDSVPPLDRPLPDEAPTGVEDTTKLLATLIEGRSESLVTLAKDVAPHVSQHFPSVDAVTEQIKLLAKRQPLIKDHVTHLLDETQPKLKGSPNIFEDESQDRFWQWQVTVVDLLPNKNAIKQRRAKIRKEVQHLHNLVAVLQTLKQLLQSNAPDNAALTAKLSRQEEKVLQYQREQAKAALEQQLKESQRQEKEKAKLAKKEAEAAKKKEAVAKRKEADAKKKEAAAANKKASLKEAANAKKEAKAKEAEERAKLAEQQKRKKEAQLRRSQNTMLSFLKMPASTPTKKKEAPVEVEHATSAQESSKENEIKDASGFDVNDFRSQINSCKHDAVVSFASHSENARRSRRRRSRYVQLSVYVTVEPDNPFEGRAYADLQQISVRNRYKFLSFNEDVRPPYHGTWSKKSNRINPRNPFKKDREYFDYDYDSEAEWEEGDNDAGEDIENAADDEEEKDDEEGDADDDGWLAADDDLDDDPDEETKLLRQKVVGQDEKTLEKTKSFICPVNGKAISLSTANAIKLVEGFSSVEDALKLLSSHKEVIVDDTELYLDPFPPALVEEDSAPSSPSDNNETSHADMQAFLRFVHHNSSASKDKLVEDLRVKLPDVTSSRAQAFRTLELVAEKKKHPIKGSIWEVKRDILEQYDLDDLLDETTEDDPESAKQKVLRTLASHIHNSTHTSKERLVDDLQANHSSILLSRAETMRHVDALAEKKKRPGGGVLWEVKSTAQRNLGIELMSIDSSDSTDANAGSDPPSAKKRKLSTDEGDRPNTNE